VVLEHGVSESYRVLSAAWLRLGESGHAYEAAALSRDFDPSATDSYRSLSAALRSQGHAADEVIPLMEGAILTADPGLNRDIVAWYLYHPTSDSGCAISTGVDGPHLNTACGTVHKSLCSAQAEALRLLMRNGRADAARARLTGAVQGYGCEAAPLEKILADR
jgi:hypothetical protein